MTLVSRVLCLRSGRSGLKFKVQGAKGQYGETNMASIKFILKVFTFASSNGQETNFSRRVRQGGTLTLCFFSIPIQVLDKNPPLSSAWPEKERHQRGGSKHASRGPCDLNGITRFQILAGQKYSWGHWGSTTDWFWFLFFWRLRVPGAVEAIQMQLWRLSWMATTWALDLWFSHWRWNSARQVKETIDYDWV